MNWKRFIILIVSIMSMAGIRQLVIACSDGPDPYSAPSFFLNTVNKQPAFVPFYYTPDLAFYSDGYNFKETGLATKYIDPNPALWREYTGRSVTIADIDSFIYKYSHKDVENIYLFIKKKTTLDISDKVLANSLTQWLIKNNDAEAAQYIAYAKACEPYTTPLEGIWNDKKGAYFYPRQDSAAMERLSLEGIKHYEVAIKKEIKLRYAYQVVRMSFYENKYLQAVSLFDNMVPEFIDNCIYYRSLSLKAGALYKMGRKAEAAYIYSQVFDKTDENREGVYLGFKWAVNGNIDGALALCKNEHEKAVLYIMKGLYNYEGSYGTMLSTIEKAYAHDPKVKGLDIVMTRNINKLEDAFLQTIATASNNHDTMLGELNAFAQKVAAESKSGDKAYWYLSSAYIYLLDGEADNCKKYLDKAAAEKMTLNEQDVHAIINVLAVMRREPYITPQTEADLLPLLQAVDARSYKEKRYADLLSNLLVTVLKTAYMQQGDEEKAIYCYSRSGPSRYYNSNDYTDEAGKMLESMPPDSMYKIQAFIQKKNKTPFEAWLTEKTIYTTGALYELEATKQIRMMQFDKAVEILKKVPDSILHKQELPDVMVSHILDGQQWNKSDKAVRYTKLTFAKKMVELQQVLKKTPTDGRAAYQYANALYSMSYYGKAHHAYDYYQNSTDEYAYFNYKERSKLQPYELEHYNVQMAERYYEQAFENSTDKEVKARCLFMAAKCWQKNCKVTGAQSYYSPDVVTYYRSTFINPYLQALKSTYADTKLFAEARGTCSYFRDYVKSKK